MTPRERVQKALNDQTPDRTPRHSGLKNAPGPADGTRGPRRPRPPSRRVGSRRAPRGGCWSGRAGRSATACTRTSGENAIPIGGRLGGRCEKTFAVRWPTPRPWTTCGTLPGPLRSSSTTHRWRPPAAATSHTPCSMDLPTSGNGRGWCGLGRHVCRYGRAARVGPFPRSEVYGLLP